ncbi:SufE family protein [Thiocapsa bogorovii]|jgi:cysteine desulfuration protein SufE|uniref:SufE family protein n=1 Tax=Thiocapsa bogorovii TaxID=521689 RepID=UPI001E580243|nr:SufE family protein [Thiocapsa bogorovii]UHD17278.1 SufE family protein [Thiocapsa bogorovii]
MLNDEMAEILENFELLGDWDERYQYLVEIGERLPPMPPEEKTDKNRVVECMSLVHTAARPIPDQPGHLEFTGDCDTAIIKGVVALLVGLFSEKRPEEIEALDVEELFEALRLQEHLSPNRHVGVYAIVNKMKGQARSTPC